MLVGFHRPGDIGLFYRFAPLAWKQCFAKVACKEYQQYRADQEKADKITRVIWAEIIPTPGFHFVRNDVRYNCYCDRQQGDQQEYSDLFSLERQG